MTKAVDLLVQWDQFNERYPAASLSDFCRYFLAPSSEADDQVQQGSTLLRTMSRITSAFSLYHRAAMAEIKMPSEESFFFLDGISRFGEIQKTDLINYLFFEYTTGMEAITKLIKNGLVIEKTDPNDKRAKLLRLTAKGKRLLNKGYRQSSRVSELIFKGVPADSINLGILFLRNIEEKHAPLAIALKNKDFDEIYKKLSEQIIDVNMH